MEKGIATRWDALLSSLTTTSTSSITTTTSSTPIIVEYSSIRNDRQAFIDRFEARNIPVIITGAVCAEEGWVEEDWDIEKLVGEFGDICWRTSDTHGGKCCSISTSNYSFL
jgi:hypothetical protein